MRLIQFIIFAFIFCACTAEEIPDISNLEGNYTGSFYRSVPNTDFRTSEISLNLENGKYSGGSSIAKYPAICRGTYEIIGQEIIFTNECAWTAEFDWSLILHGSFEFNAKEGSLTSLTRKSGNSTDVYILNKTK